MIFSLLIYVFLISASFADICDLCKCEKIKCESLITGNEFICMKNVSDFYKCDDSLDQFKKHNINIEIDNIQWPIVGNIVMASFNNLNLNYLTKLLCASTESVSPILVAINFDDNNIERITNDPFQYCKNLQYISIANNSIQKLANDFLKSSFSLEFLNLSFNALEEFNGELLLKNKRLIELDVSHNQITTLKLNEILNVSSKIKKIHANNNLIFVVNGDRYIKYSSLEYLNLAGNKLTVITSTSFISFEDLHFLDISRNHLSNIEDDSFLHLNNLTILNLSENNLQETALKLPNSLENLRMISNKLKFWPFVNRPTNLSIIEVQQNSLIEMFSRSSSSKTIEFENLLKLNVSYNRIEVISTLFRFPKLLDLDLSYNRLQNIPQYLDSQAPSLDLLRLNGNPISEVRISNKLTVQRLELSYLENVIELDANELSLIESKTGCIELTISHCPKLKNIHENFQRLKNLCKLDLSYNGLTTIDSNWANWSSLDRGIDIQGNPIDCTCSSSQWLLDIYIPLIYARPKQQYLLHHLKCASPQSFENNRLLKYYKQEKAFCGGYQPNKMYLELIQKAGTEPMWYQNQDNIINIITMSSLLLVIILCSISIAVILIRRRRENKRLRNNRRYINGGFL